MLNSKTLTQSELYIGLMSGTSLDGVDAVLADFSQHPPQLLNHHYSPYPHEMKTRLARLSAAPQIDIFELGQTDIELASYYATTANALLQSMGLPSDQIAAIGCHGQTIRHAPRSPYPFTMQIGDPSTLAEKTGITVVAQFRQRDMAAGGQGAPLVPTFHRFLFGNEHKSQIILNLGGIANITWLPRETDQIVGFDTGPANVLMDSWCQQHTEHAYDPNGMLARRGKLNEPLLKSLQSHPYFAAPPPKSTGREQFHLEWVEDSIKQLDSPAPPFADILRTLTELTAWSVANAIARMNTSVERLIACGGGAYNGFLLERLAEYMPHTQVMSCMDLGVKPDHIEALAFAWLARQTLLGLPGNHPAVTGAKGFRVLGGIYPA